jgi:hypothetical protein
MKRVAIVQSNYIPWKGYFDLMAAVDEFILYDDMQYTRRDWRNRNQIKTPQGLQWLSVPVQVKGRYHQTIRETLIDGEAWATDHWKTLQQNYRRAPHFETAAGWLEPYYRQRYTHLVELNHALLRGIAAALGISTLIRCSWDYQLAPGKTERLLLLCQQAGATHYVSGPSARGYLDTELFNAAGLSVEWFDYAGYLEYHQLWGDFQHGVSILDLLFNTGPQAATYLRYTPMTQARSRKS